MFGIDFEKTTLVDIPNKIVQDLHISILLLCIENHESTQNPTFFYMCAYI